MRYFIYLFIFAILSCSKSKKEDTQTTQQGFKIEVKSNSRLSTGEFIANPTEAVIHVWKSDDRSFEIKSITDAISGYAFDNKSNKSIKSDYQALSYEMIKSVPPGQYLVFVAQTSNSSYSTINFNLNAGGWMDLKKIFTTHAPYASYEEWFAAE